MKKKFSMKTFLLVISGLLLLGIIAFSGTYAYFAWNSTGENKNATVSVSSVDGQGQCNKVIDNERILFPVSNRNNGRIITVSTRQTLSEYAYITWTLTINSINTATTETAGLKHQSFKYELVNTTTGESYGSGNFLGKDIGDTITFSNNTEVLPYNVTNYFALYLWIDGTIGKNNNDILNQTYSFDLVCDITGANVDGTNDTFISSKGKPYKRVMEVNLTPAQFNSQYGSTPELKEITFRPQSWLPYDLAGFIFASEGGGMETLFKNAPNLEVLRLKPVYCGDKKGFVAGHYGFEWLPASVRYIEIGSLESEGEPWGGAGYFRKNNSQLDPPWTQGVRIGNTNGLTLVVYMRNYNVRGGFINNGSNDSLPLDTTTLIVKSSITGEVLTG